MVTMAEKKLPEEVLEYFRQQGAKGGRIGSKARMEKLTPAERSAYAKNAVNAREAQREQKRKDVEQKGKKTAGKVKAG